MADDERDFLDEITAEATAENSAFPALVEAAEQRRAIERETVARHDRLGLANHDIADPVQSKAGSLLPREKRAKQASIARSFREGR